MPFIFRHLSRLLAAAGVTFLVPMLPGADVTASPDPAVQQLIEQNRKLQERLDAQQKEIDELKARLDAAPPANAAPPTAPVRRETDDSTGPDIAGFTGSSHTIRISGDAGLAVMSSGADGAYPNARFTVDEARLFVEAPIWNSVYFFGGLDLASRESPDDAFHLGEFYVDAEGLFGLNHGHGLTLRAGYFNIPFGEEYQNRHVMENPLITHSLADIWGYEEGVEAFGSFGPAQYTVAVQNSGTATKDKSITARLGFDPIKHLHLSVSAHNTGQVDTATDYLSQIWFGGAFFRGLSPTTGTKDFRVSLYQADATVHWQGGHFGAALGLADYSDDNPTVEESRHLHYGSAEVVQNFNDSLYGAVRFSEIRAPHGYPLMGLGNGGKYFYNPFAPLTTDLQRLSVGLGYIFGPPLVWKVEYTWERGHLVAGPVRDDENLLSTELGIRF
ncbi:MAG TPA: hypothetical protein VHD32_09615 [Candidatus Didemnitutus sp.]|nr:hypothetical protein [Candidatus Didemnitutus sp.]